MPFFTPFKSNHINFKVYQRYDSGVDWKISVVKQDGSLVTVFNDVISGGGSATIVQDIPDDVYMAVNFELGRDGTNYGIGSYTTLEFDYA